MRLLHWETAKLGGTVINAKSSLQVLGHVNLHWVEDWSYSGLASSEEEHAAAQHLSSFLPWWCPVHMFEVVA